MPLWQEYLKLLRRFQSKRRKFRRTRRAVKSWTRYAFVGNYRKRVRKQIRRRYKRYRRKGY